jgi:hypothetical protein
VQPLQFQAAFYLFLLMVLVATQAPAGQPMTLKAAAARLAQSGYMTEAFNFVQDTRGLTIRPHVAEVWCDSGSNRFYLKGPVTGKEMSMDRDQFIQEIFYPSYLWLKLHTSTKSASSPIGSWP